MAVGTDNYPYAAWHGGPANAGDKRSRLHSPPADADCVGLAGNSWVADIDIVIARGEISTGSPAQCDVEAAGCIVPEREKTHGRVAAAGCIALERSSAGGRVEETGIVSAERTITGGRVAAAGCVAKERTITG